MKGSSIAIMLALLSGPLICGGSFPAYGASFWTCVRGKWTPVGSPRHGRPMKSCGSSFPVPQTQSDCEAAGGRWGPAGIFPRPICKVPTHDAGRPCGDVDECEGICLASLSQSQRALVIQRQRLAIMGRCTPYVPVFGCMALVKKGYVSGLMCRD
jgi:hypothetical protein